MKIPALLFKRTLLVVSIFSFSAIFSLLISHECISHFHADIIINKVGSLTVTETITAYVKGNHIKKGIYRDFPTRYAKGFLFSMVEFYPVSAFINGKELSFLETKHLKRGKRVFLRNTEYLEINKEHTFIFTYITTRQLGFFENYDELYWNIVGGDWEIPIVKVTATVHLPEGLSTSQCSVCLYAGDLGTNNKGHNAQVVKESESSFFLSLTPSSEHYAIQKGQAFTCSVTFPKGHVKQPTVWQNMYFTIGDNWGFLWVVAWIFFLLGMVAFQYYKLWRRIIIPLFEPPTGLSPAMIRFIMKEKIDPIALSAEIIRLAVNGYLTIELKKDSWFSKTFILSRTEKKCSIVFDEKALEIMFPGKNKYCFLNKEQHKKITEFSEHQMNVCKPLHDVFQNGFRKYVVRMIFFSIVGIIGAFLFGLKVALVDWCIDDFFIAAIIFIVSWFPYRYFVPFYTAKGLDLYDKIKGFKFYLSITEKQRLPFTTTPPIKTPEIYEKLLPYAIVLGVEKLWTKKFTPVFQELEKQGTPYRFAWSDGFVFDSFKGDIVSSMSTALASSIAQADLSSSSGLSGRGSSGRGGGGGGGGGC